MSQLTTYPTYGFGAAEAPAPAAFEALAPYKDRVNWMPLTFLLPTAACGASWLAGGVPLLTDFGFTVLTVLCAFFLLGELINFPRRFGIGGLVLFGGVLIWFSYDYMRNWAGADFASGLLPQPADIIAKAATLHCIFIGAMSAGLLLPFGRWLEKLILLVPEPPTQRFYLWVIILMALVGISPYFLFVAEPFYSAIWKSITAGRAGGGPAWTVGRTGNVNYSYGAYVAQILQVGQMGGILGMVYAVLIARTIWAKAFGWGLWAFWLLISVGGTRGETVFFLLPAAGIVYIKYNAVAAEAFRKFSLKAHVLLMALLLMMLFIVQMQGQFRLYGYADVDLREVNLKEIRGNSMFTETLAGFAVIPQHRDFFADNPLEATIRPIPDAVFWFVVSPIPRAIWNNKPLDPAWVWYNELVTGGRFDGREGTTISQGAVGYWYYRYGVIGVIQGGLFLGWILVVLERVLQKSEGRVMVMLTSLALATWMFRNFRGLNFVTVHSTLVGIGGYSILILLVRLLTGRK